MSTLTEVITLIVAVGAVTFGGLATWLAARRKTSGKIGTSEADVLWAQSQAMRDTLVAQLAKTEQQRDKLIDSQAGTLLPLVAAVNETMQQLGESISIVIAHAERETLHDEGVTAAMARVENSVGAIAKALEARDAQVLQITGTARAGAADAAEDPGEGHGDRPADQPGG